MMAGLDSTGSAGTGIEVATVNRIRFTLDRNMDGEFDGTNSERITYAYNNATNRLDQWFSDDDDCASSPDCENLMDNVINASFVYQDADGNPPAALDDIRTVLISITVQEPAGRGGMVNRTYTNRVRCRNLGL
jgi:hypothetical protein